LTDGFEICRARSGDLGNSTSASRFTRFRVDVSVPSDGLLTCLRTVQVAQ